MRRAQMACLNQMLHFMLKDDIEHAEAMKLVKAEVKEYKEHLVKKQIPHKIVSEETQADGSVILMVKKQFNSYDVGDYLK